MFCGDYGQLNARTGLRSAGSAALDAPPDRRAPDERFDGCSAPMLEPVASRRLPGTTDPLQVDHKVGQKGLCNMSGPLAVLDSPKVMLPLRHVELGLYGVALAQPLPVLRVCLDVQLSVFVCSLLGYAVRLAHRQSTQGIRRCGASRSAFLTAVSQDRNAELCNI
jgi:hypothetical protein